MVEEPRRFFGLVRTAATDGTNHKRVEKKGLSEESPG